jgi:acetyl-CoA synthetase
MPPTPPCGLGLPNRSPDCFKEYADLLTWDAYWHTTLDTSHPPFWKWFVGRLNAPYNCVDRHLATHRNKAVIIWVPEPEQKGPAAITYQVLHRRVNAFGRFRFCGHGAVKRSEA